MNDSYELAALCGGAPSNNIGSGTATIIGAMDCLPPLGNATGVGVHHHHNALVAVGGAPGVPGASATTAALVGVGGGGGAVGVTGGGVSIIPYQHHVNLNLNHHHLLAGHHSPYSNNYPLHHSSSHHHIHSDQTKPLQELQHEVGALLEFRDLVIETFPDLKHKMASMSSSASTAVAGSGGGGGNSTTTSVSGTNTLTGGMSSSSLASSRREWEPGIRIKRKLSQKEPSTSSTSTVATTTTTATGGAVVAATATTSAATVGELSSSSLTRSRSNSHSGKKEPKSGENHNGSVVQDSGFSTETSSSKDGHSASSTNGAITGPIASNRLSCVESDDELLNLLDVIHRKSNRLREEMDQLQNYERQNLRGNKTNNSNTNSNNNNNNDETVGKSSSSNLIGDLTPKTFREHVERLNKEDIKQLRKERDRLLDKLAEMEAETLTGRIKAAKMNDQVEELISVKKDLEEQLKLAMAQKLELSSRVQQLQLQQSKSSSSSQSEYSSQRNFLSSASTVLSTGGSGLSHVDGNALLSTPPTRRPNTFQPVIVEQQQQQQREQHQDSSHVNAFHQSAGSDNSNNKQLTPQSGGGGGVGGVLGRLDGVVSTPGARNAKCRIADSKRFAAILLETSVIELQRHLLTLTVQNQVLMQKLEQATKSKSHLAKRLDKSKEDVEDLRFQLEEKNIELEGTKAQLRVLESRIHSVTPTTTTATNSNSSYLLHSHNDYETNRSSASTTLMLSRRGTSGIDSHCSEMRSGTPNNMQMPAPTSTQISTPSMKAMVHLPMDDMQQHSSSTESAHEHDELMQPHTPQPQTGGAGGVSRLMSASVGGVSPFDVAQQQARGQQLLKKFVNGSAASSKPSKIPLPGSKTASYFANKPPTGRSSTAGRSPPSAHTSTGSNASSKSSLSRSTGNLLYSKSPNSLKRADSAQSIRKDNNNSSLSMNTSRSSTSSSIPLSTTPYNGGAASRLNTSPSPRVLQNSPLPKLKRESLTSRMRHMDSLSRMHHNQQQQQQQTQNHSNTSDFSSGNLSSPPPPLTPATTTATLTTSPYTSAVSSHQNNSSNGSSFLVSSTPKPTSAIVTQFNSALRKDLQLSSSSFSHGATQPFTRRSTATANVSPSSASGGSSATRRFSSASVLGARVAARTQQQQQLQEQQQQHQQQQQQQLSGGNGNGNASSDTDSGKSSTVKSRIDWMCEQRNTKNKLNSAIADESSTIFGHYERQSRDDLLIYDADVWHVKARQPAWWQRAPNAETDTETMYSDNLLVTFDYGYTDMNSFEAQLSHDSRNECDQLTWNVYPIKEEVEKEREDDDEEETSTYGSWDYKSNTPLQSLKPLKSAVVNQQQFNKNEMAEQEIWFHTPNALSTSAFEVHHVQHVATKADAMSLLSNCSHMEYDVTDDDEDADEDDEDEDNNDDDVNVPEHVQMNREHWERAYEYDGNAYYDSLGCI